MLIIQKGLSLYFNHDSHFTFHIWLENVFSAPTHSSWYDDILQSNAMNFNWLNDKHIFALNICLHNINNMYVCMYGTCSYRYRSGGERQRGKDTLICVTGKMVLSCISHSTFILFAFTKNTTHTYHFSELHLEKKTWVVVYFLSSLNCIVPKNNRATINNPNPLRLLQTLKLENPFKQTNVTTTTTKRTIPIGIYYYMEMTFDIYLHWCWLLQLLYLLIFIFWNYCGFVWSVLRR